MDKIAPHIIRRIVAMMPLRAATVFVASCRAYHDAAGRDLLDLVTYVDDAHAVQCRAGVPPKCLRNVRTVEITHQDTRPVRLPDYVEYIIIDAFPSSFVNIPRNLRAICAMRQGRNYLSNEIIAQIEHYESHGDTPIMDFYVYTSARKLKSLQLDDKQEHMDRLIKNVEDKEGSYQANVDLSELRYFDAPVIGEITVRKLAKVEYLAMTPEAGFDYQLLSGLKNLRYLNLRFFDCGNPLNTLFQLANLPHLAYLEIALERACVSLPAAETIPAEFFANLLVIVVDNYELRNFFVRACEFCHAKTLIAGSGRCDVRIA